MTYFQQSAKISSRQNFRPYGNTLRKTLGPPGNVVFQVKEDSGRGHCSTASHAISLPVQGLTVREFEGCAAQTCFTAISTLPEWCFKFALNTVMDTLPHNTNLYKWKKLSSPWCQLCGEHQFLAHVLNSCQKALNLRHYTARHNHDLAVIFDFFKCHLPWGCRSLPTFQASTTSPRTLAPLTSAQTLTSGAPASIHLMELTVPLSLRLTPPMLQRGRSSGKRASGMPVSAPSTPTPSRWRSA